MIKKVVFGILILGIIAVFGQGIFMANFDIFDAPSETELKTECDYEGLRKIRMTQESGNATANRSIIIYATDCNYDEQQPELIFVASASFIKPKDVNFEWKNFDTLTVKYNNKLEIFEQKKYAKSVKPEIVIEYIAQ